MSGAEIAAEVAAALAEASAATGSGPLICTIRRPSTEPDEPQDPWDDTADPANEPTDYPVTAVEKIKRLKDMKGNLIGETMRILTINATGIVPLKSDRIAVGVAPADVVEETAFEEILNIVTVAPGGVALMYELELMI